MMTSRMAKVFDNPQWKWREENDSDPDLLRISPIAVIHEGMRPLGEVRIVPPSEFYHFVQSTHGSDVWVDGFTLQRVAGGRTYFSYDYSTPSETGTITLWYFTKSNLPYWAKRFLR